MTVDGCSAAVSVVIEKFFVRTDVVSSHQNEVWPRAHADHFSHAVAFRLAMIEQSAETTRLLGRINTGNKSSRSGNCISTGVM